MLGIVSRVQLSPVVPSMRDDSQSQTRTMGRPTQSPLSKIETFSALLFGSRIFSLELGAVANNQTKECGWSINAGLDTTGPRKATHESS